MPNCERVKVVVLGAVQGVGFRPFVYRLAKEFHLQGWVLNSSQGVFIEAEGEPADLRRFLLRLGSERPPRAVIQSLESSFLDSLGYDRFEIRESEESGAKSAFILPDIATCADCLREIFDPDNRRFHYPFTNCTNCGPRFSIIESLPYDRANTSMKNFTMCAECAAEYADPNDRRFHAEPIACPRCGPQLQWWDSLGAKLAVQDAALLQAAEVIRAGKIVALKGIGGFQLIVDARSNDAVRRLRDQKHREEKPFAVMFPSIAEVKKSCDVSELEERLLLSAESPIVLLQRRALEGIAESVAPRNPHLGAMLPYTPLHHLLMRELNFPVIATSGNLSDEPICIDEYDALKRLHGIADFFLVHDRPIVRQIDDSILRMISGRESVMRRARGYAPLPITLNSKSGASTSECILALGAHLKNTVALSIGTNIFVSQHIGDLSTQPAYEAFTRVASDLPRLYDVTPNIVAHDLHPEYLSTKYAPQFATRTVAIQHHWAHVAACMAENEIEPPALGVAWDGTGFGSDGNIWGGEFFRVGKNSCERIAHFRQFRLPGGDAAVKEPRRSALGILHEILGEQVWENRGLTSHFFGEELQPLRTMLTKNINSPRTSSVGRLFDGVAALLGLRTRSSFEGQAAMELEFAVQTGVAQAYHFELSAGPPLVVDWEAAILGLQRDQENGESLGRISAKFHNMLAETIVAVAEKIGESKVVLSGGCFQNRYLTERTIHRLLAKNFRPYWHQRIPPNDGGISLGQVVAVNWMQPARS